MDIFEMMVAYYCNKKWADCKRFVDEHSVFRHPIYDDFKVGDENDLQGALIVANGSTTPKNLIKDKILIRKQGVRGSWFANLDDFVSILEDWKKKDGAMVVDFEKSFVIHAGILDTASMKLADIEYTIDNMLPADFKCEDGSNYECRIGSKSDMAIKVSKAYSGEVDTIVLREAAYTPLGMGTVARFNGGRLIEMFYLKHASDSAGPFIDKERKFIGVYRRYVDEHGDLCKNKHGKIIPYFECIVDFSLKDKDGRYVKDGKYIREKGKSLPSKTEYASLENLAAAGN